MKSTLTILFICINQLIFSQKEDSLMMVADQVEISSLSSSQEHKAFFRLIWDLDQSIRKTERDVVAEFGYSSPKHDSIVAIWETIDRFTFNKMREYLSIHPFPSRDKYKASPGLTIITVFHHVPGTPEDIDLKRLYFPIFFKAYENGDLYIGDLWMFLYRLYKQINNENYVNQELGDEEQIEEMVRLLELEKK